MSEFSKLSWWRWVPIHPRTQVFKKNNRNKISEQEISCKKSCALVILKHIPNSFILMSLFCISHLILCFVLFSFVVRNKIMRTSLDNTNVHGTAAPPNSPKNANKSVSLEEDLRVVRISFLKFKIFNNIFKMLWNNIYN